MRISTPPGCNRTHMSERGGDHERAINARRPPSEREHRRPASGSGARRAVDV